VTPRLCALTGAGGALGPVVAREFAVAGFAVRALARRAVDRSLFPAGTEFGIVDVLDREAIEQQLIGVDTVVHLAALLHVVNPPPSLAAEYERVNVGGTRNVLAGAATAGVRRLVLFSTIAVYGYGSGAILDESTTPAPATPYGASKLEAEEVASTASAPDGAPLTAILRLGAVYGSRVKGNYRRLVHSLARGLFVGVGDGRNRRTLVYERDAARAAVAASTHPAAAGRTFNVTDGEFHTVREIMDTIARALGRGPRRLSIPTAPARFAAGLIEDAFRLAGRTAPVGRATIDKFVEDVAVDGSRITRELGFHPNYDLERGWAETIAEMKRAGVL
jgi:nucleoside-diphosphate-sugar epimerase